MAMAVSHYYRNLRLVQGTHFCIQNVKNDYQSVDLQLKNISEYMSGNKPVTKPDLECEFPHLFGRGEGAGI
jgi:hypothetical protein